MVAHVPAGCAYWVRSGPDESNAKLPGDKLNFQKQQVPSTIYARFCNK